MENSKIVTKRRRCPKEPTGKVFEAVWLVVVKDRSQAEAGRLAGLSQSTVCRWLKRFNLHRGAGGKYPKFMSFSPATEGKVAKTF